MLKQISRIFISGFVSFMLSSCTVISIENTDVVKTQFYPGLVIIQVVDAHNNIAINSLGFGANFNGGEATFGYFHDQRVYVNDLSKCITVFFETQTDPLIYKKNN